MFLLMISIIILSLFPIYSFSKSEELEYLIENNLLFEKENEKIIMFKLNQNYFRKNKINKSNSCNYFENLYDISIEFELQESDSSLNICTVTDNYIILYFKSKRNSEKIETFLKNNNILYVIEVNFIIEYNEKLFDIKKKENENENETEKIKTDAASFYQGYEFFSVPWHLDRIDQKFYPLDNSYKKLNNGNSTHVYIVDNGIDSSHNEFSQSINKLIFHDFTNNNNLRHGVCGSHGTSVASVISSSNIGVSNNIIIHDIDTSNYLENCGFDLINILSGLSFIINNGIQGSVINLSWSVLESQCIESLLMELNELGFIITTSSGNYRHDDPPFIKNPCIWLPGRLNFVFNIGGINTFDRECTFCKYGPCVDYYLPSVNILVASYKNINSYEYVGGTSFGVAIFSSQASQIIDENIEKFKSNNKNSRVILAELIEKNYTIENQIIQNIENNKIVIFNDSIKLNCMKILQMILILYNF